VTLPAASARVQFADIESAVAALRARGMRVTQARRMILGALFAAGAPISTEELARRAGDREGVLDVASVYRNLEAFEQAGLVRHVHLGHGPGLYALVGEGEREYLYCERCGTARSVSPEELEEVRALVQRRFGHRARFTHFPIVGLCADCALESVGSE
jgi:Fur family ferric uptake transcriptional regulator